LGQPLAELQKPIGLQASHGFRDYVPLADEWGLWDNHSPPPIQIADSKTHTIENLEAMINATDLQETPPREMSEMSKIVLEAGRVATAKMLDYYKRMGIRVTPQMTLAPEPKKRSRKKA
jgi:hypothetical protein